MYKSIFFTWDALNCCYCARDRYTTPPSPFIVLLTLSRHSNWICRCFTLRESRWKIDSCLSRGMQVIAYHQTLKDIFYDPNTRWEWRGSSYSLSSFFYNIMESRANDVRRRPPFVCDGSDCRHFSNLHSLFTRTCVKWLQTEWNWCNKVPSSCMMMMKVHQLWWRSREWARAHTLRWVNKLIFQLDLKYQFHWN